MKINSFKFNFICITLNHIHRRLGALEQIHGEKKTGHPEHAKSDRGLKKLPCGKKPGAKKMKEKEIFE